MIKLEEQDELRDWLTVWEGRSRGDEQTDKDKKNGIGGADSGQQQEGPGLRSSEGKWDSLVFFFWGGVPVTRSATSFLSP